MFEARSLLLGLLKVVIKCGLQIGRFRSVSHLWKCLGELLFRIVQITQFLQQQITKGIQL
jgi:hypothetical protein